MPCRFPLVLLACWVGVQSASAQSAPFAKRYALLIGVNRYKNINFSNLYYAEKDVTELARILRGQKYEVVLLSGAEGAKDEKLAPTKANIDAHIRAVLERCTRDDLLLFGFAGHGVQFKPEPGNDKNPQSYFCPADAHPHQSSTMIALEDLYERMSGCGAAVKLMLVDACRVEVKIRERSSIDGRNTPPPPVGVSVLFGCKAGQAALEDNELRHGLFFYHVLDGLRGKAKNADGEVAWLRLAAHTAEAVRKSGQQQIPVLRGEVEGDPFLVRIAPEAGSGPAKELRTQGGIKLTFIAPGGFLRGDSKVALAKGFYLGVYEVTQAEFHAVLGKNPSAFAPTGEGRNEVQGLATDRFPVDSISAEDAAAFCKALSAREGKMFRLPTEDEWEYACRAGSASTFHTGETLPENRAHFNYAGNKRRTIEVGQFPANAFGLHDMHGNVAEWCTSTKAPGKYVLRGGSWASAPDKCASGHSLTLPADYSNTTTGFRILYMAD
jgi:hypothetical protein